MGDVKIMSDQEKTIKMQITATTTRATLSPAFDMWAQNGTKVNFVT